MREPIVASPKCENKERDPKQIFEHAQVLHVLSKIHAVNLSGRTSITEAIMRITRIGSGKGERRRPPQQIAHSR